MGGSNRTAKGSAAISQGESLTKAASNGLALPPPSAFFEQAQRSATIEKTGMSAAMRQGMGRSLGHLG